MRNVGRVETWLWWRMKCSQWICRKFTLTISATQLRSSQLGSPASNVESGSSELNHWLSDIPFDTLSKLRIYNTTTSHLYLAFPIHTTHSTQPLKHKISTNPVKKKQKHHVYQMPNNLPCLHPISPPASTFRSQVYRNPSSSSSIRMNREHTCLSHSLGNRFGRRAILLCDRTIFMCCKERL